MNVHMEEIISTKIGTTEVSHGRNRRRVNEFIK